MGKGPSFPRADSPFPGPSFGLFTCSLMASGAGLPLNCRGGLPSRDHCPFPWSPSRSPGCPPSHATAQWACPVHGAAAAGPANPGSEGNRGVGPRFPHSHVLPQPFPFQFQTLLISGARLWGCGPSGCVPGALWGLTCHRCSGFSLGKKDLAPPGNRMAFHSNSLTKNTKIDTYTQIYTPYHFSAHRETHAKTDIHGDTYTHKNRHTETTP